MLMVFVNNNEVPYKPVVFPEDEVENFAATATPDVSDKNPPQKTKSQNNREEWKKASSIASKWLLLFTLFLIRWVRAVVLFTYVAFLKEFSFFFISLVSCVAVITSVFMPSWMACILACISIYFIQVDFLTWGLIETALRSRFVFV